MVYWAGKQDHKIENEKMVDHIVELVEKRSKENRYQSISIVSDKKCRFYNFIDFKAQKNRNMNKWYHKKSLNKFVLGLPFLRPKWQMVQLLMK